MYIYEYKYLNFSKSCLEWFKEGAVWIIQDMFWTISCRICNHISGSLSFKSKIWMIDLKYPESLKFVLLLFEVFLCHTLSSFQLVSGIIQKQIVWMIHDSNNTDGSRKGSRQTEFAILILLTLGNVWFWHPRKELYNMNINILRRFKTKRFPWVVKNYNTCFLHSQ